MSSRDHPDWWRPTGGQNSQDSILERRSLVWNDNGVEAPNAPPAFYTGVHHKGKFFPRGCRGMIEQLQIYCINTAGGSLQLRYSPHPGLGPVNTVTITPAATWGWVGVDIEEMWNYDSLFIWVFSCQADVSWGYDATLPFDGHESTDAGATWEDMAIRPFIRVVYTGETPGDVPVSGIVNNIPLPNFVPDITNDWVMLNVPGGGTLYYEVEGIGTIKLAIWYVSALASYNNLAPWIEVDGTLIQLNATSLAAMHNQFDNVSAKEGITWPNHDVVNDRYTMQWKLDIPFRRYARIGFDNTGVPAAPGFVFIIPFMLR